MRRSASPRLGAYAGLAALALAAALIDGRPELVALGAPFALVLAVGLALTREPSLAVEMDLESARAIEGEEVEVVLTLTAEAAVPSLEVLLALPEGLEAPEGGDAVALSLRAGERREHRLRIRAPRWDAFLVGEIRLRARGALGLVVYEGAVDARRPLRIYPGPERLRGLLRPLETQALVGDQVARIAGEGLEAAEVRPFVAGDRVRRINWRVSARRGALHVTERHPERNADVVLLVDSFTEVGGRGGTLDASVRAAAGLAGAYLAGRDRLGLVGLGGTLRWLVPAGGLAQAYRLVDALLDTRITMSYAWAGVELLPPRTLPPKALVLVLSPLLDRRIVRAVVDLRARRFDLAVIEVSPLPWIPPGQGEAGELAMRIWAARREELRDGLRRLGVGVVEWRRGTPLDAALEEVRAFRRRARLPRAS
jgi:uncharacterized protein (DUF58 family)